MLSDGEKELIEEIQKGNKIGIYELIRTFKREGIENFITVRREYIDIMINLIEKQKNIIDSIKRILEDEELDYCDTLDEIYHFYEEVVNNVR